MALKKSDNCSNVFKVYLYNADYYLKQVDIPRSSRLWIN